MLVVSKVCKLVSPCYKKRKPGSNVANFKDGNPIQHPNQELKFLKCWWKPEIKYRLKINSHALKIDGANGIHAEPSLSSKQEGNLHLPMINLKKVVLQGLIKLDGAWAIHKRLVFFGLCQTHSKPFNAGLHCSISSSFVLQEVKTKGALAILIARLIMEEEWQRAP